MKKFIAAVLALTLCLGACAALADHFVIATDTVFKPFEYTDMNGNFVGIDVDLLAAACRNQLFVFLQNLGGAATDHAKAQNCNLDHNLTTFPFRKSFFYMLFLL